MKPSGALVPARFVTVTVTGPAAFAGVVKVRVVPVGSIESGTRPVVSPMLTVEPGRKPEPVSVTTVRPATGPSTGSIVASTGAPAGGAVYVNGSGADVPPAVVTVTVTSPTVFGGVVNVSDVPAGSTESGTRPVVSPMVTVEPAVKPVPVTVTTVPPPAGPWAGSIVSSTGAVGGAGR